MINAYFLKYSLSQQFINIAILNSNFVEIMRFDRTFNAYYMHLAYTHIYIIYILYIYMHNACMNICIDL